MYLLFMSRCGQMSGPYTPITMLIGQVFVSMRCAFLIWQNDVQSVQGKRMAKILAEKHAEMAAQILSRYFF